MLSAEKDLGWSTFILLLGLCCDHNVSSWKATIPLDLRQEIINQLSEGYGVTDVSKNLSVTKSSDVNIHNNYLHHGTVHPCTRGGRLLPLKLTDDILEAVEVWKRQKPSISALEMSDRLQREQICDPNNVMTPRTIKEAIQVKLGMTHRNITSKAKEALTGSNAIKMDEFLDYISSADPATLHFFDEASVIVTSGNRRYGSSYRGLPAVEVQCYPSNANYTINLLTCDLVIMT